jgi:hypothetical protein
MLGSETMADKLTTTAQELDSLRYFEHEESLTDAVQNSYPSNQDTVSSSERATRYMSTVVLLLLIATCGGLCWQYRQAIKSSVAQFKKHNSSGLDLVVWGIGSKKTFNEAFTDRLREPSFDTSQMKPAYKTEFSNVDLQNLSSAWNGKHK